MNVNRSGGSPVEIKSSSSRSALSRSPAARASTNASSDRRIAGVSGWRGWQWLFLLEGIPSVIIGVMVLAILPDGPKKTKWLTPEERDLLRVVFAREQALDHIVPHRLKRVAAHDERIETIERS